MLNDFCSSSRVRNNYGFHGIAVASAGSGVVLRVVWHLCPHEFPARGAYSPPPSAGSLMSCTRPLAFLPPLSLPTPRYHTAEQKGTKETGRREMTRSSHAGRWMWHLALLRLYASNRRYDRASLKTKDALGRSRHEPHG